MLKLYKYLYYRIYSSRLKKWGESDRPEWYAVGIISFMVFMNILLLGILLELAVEIRVVFGHHAIAFLISLALAIVNYFLFIHTRKYKIIIKEFENEDANNRKGNTILLWLYFILSFLLPIILMIYLRG